MVFIRTCIGSGCFTRPTGDLRLQLCRRADHVETMAPPYVFHHTLPRFASCPRRGLLDELRGSHLGVGVLEDPGELVVVERAVEAEAEPAAVADVRRAEAAIRVGLDQHLL